MTDGVSIFRAMQLLTVLDASAELHRIVYSTRFDRALDRAGYARFRRWRVYAERDLGGEPEAAWLYAEHLTLVYQDEPLAQYLVAYQPDKRRLQVVTPEQLFETPHRSPQPPLRTWGSVCQLCRGEVCARLHPSGSAVIPRMSNTRSILRLVPA